MGAARQAPVDSWYEAFARDMLTGTICMRIDHRLIDEQALEAARKRAEALGIHDVAAREARYRLAPLGITVAENSGLSAQAQLAAAFHQILFALKQFGGDPPCPKPFRDRSVDVFHGRVAPDEALLLLVADQPQLQAPLRIALELCRFDPAMVAVLSQSARVMAALAMPRSDLLALYVRHSQDRVAAARVAAHRAGLEAQAFAEQDPARARAFAVQALGFAGMTPEPDDDLALLSLLLAVPDHVLSASDLTLGAKALAALITRGVRSAELLAAFDRLVAKSCAKGSASDVASLLEPSVDALCASDLTPRQKTELLVSAVRLFARARRQSTAEKYLAHVETGPQRTELEADLLWNRGERDAAAELLLAKWYASRPSIALLFLWPEKRPGIEPYVEALVTRSPFGLDFASASPAVAAAGVIVLSGLISMARSFWSVSTLAPLFRRLDWKALERKTPPDFARMLQGVKAEARAVGVEPQDAVAGACA
jgi:hypothetical protein